MEPRKVTAPSPPEKSESGVTKFFRPWDECRPSRGSSSVDAFRQTAPAGQPNGQCINLWSVRSETANAPPTHTKAGDCQTKADPALAEELERSRNSFSAEVHCHQQQYATHWPLAVFPSTNGHHSVTWLAAGCTTQSSAGSLVSAVEQAEWVPPPTSAAACLSASTASIIPSSQSSWVRPRVRWRPRRQRPKRFQCPHCRVSFSNNGQLKGHVRIHTGERPFACDHPNCGKTFTRNEELTRHRRIHTGLRPFPCSLCGKHFGRKDHLKKHLRTHQKAQMMTLSLPAFITYGMPTAAAVTPTGHADLPNDPSHHYCPFTWPPRIT